MRRAKPEDPLQLPLFVPTSLVRIGPDEFRVIHGAPVRWLRPKDLARELGVSRRTILDWVGGPIPDEFVERIGPRLLRIDAAVLPRLRRRLDE